MRLRASRVAEPIGFDSLRSLDETRWQSILSGEPAKAAQWLEAAARYGLVEAQTLFAQLLLDGHALPKDSARAFRWFRIAADAGYAPAMNMAGRCLEHAWGVARDWEAAAAWYRRAAEASLDWAQYNLANMLLRGRGVPRDRPQALDWFLRAAAQGHAKSMNLVGRFLEEGWEMPANPSAAMAWYRRSAELGDFRGQFNLATCLIQAGRIAETTPWLQQAAETGSADFLREMDVWAQLHPDLCPKPVLQTIASRLAAIARGHGGAIPSTMAPA
ncbi:MAG TPA: tetratricopeptide repeat protein [Rhodopila sp.]|uniref:tetratricopeptide repeat protein n=1 Tax=Rhodopila sp. TaxID=2480087 RepID=UPI002C93F496|nr:tetratricopeptide repeat protein [Rhodopila sp.]HVY14550.1 tetratricopeptide repeat protein [Rhodopila sp.]